MVYGPARRLRLPLLLALLATSCAPGRTMPAAVPALALPPTVAAPVAAGQDQLLPLLDGTTAFAAIVPCIIFPYVRAETLGSSPAFSVGLMMKAVLPIYVRP